MEEFASSKRNNFERELEYAHRRKSQNRVAQRKFREKAKRRKQMTFSPQQESAIAKIGDDREHRSRSKSASLNHTSQDGDGAASIWHGSDEPPLELPSFIPAVQGPQMQLAQLSKAMFLQNEHNLLPNEVMVPETRRSQLQGKGTTESIGFPDLTALANGNPFSPTHAEGELISGQDGPFSGAKENDEQFGPTGRNNSNSCSNNFQCLDVEGLEQSHAIIQGQRIQLCNQGEQLIEKSISLVEIGISLGILPPHTDLKHLLINVQETFRAHRIGETLFKESDSREGLS